MSRREAFLRSRKIQERKVHALVCGHRRHLSRERGDRLHPRVEVPQQLLAPEGREPISSQLSGVLAAVIAREAAPQFVADRAMDHFSVDPGPAG